MKTLSVFRSRLEDPYKQIADAVAYGNETKEIHLYALEEVDYDQLLKDIFESDAVTSWW
jgi:hypothetical protein